MRNVSLPSYNTPHATILQSTSALAHDQQRRCSRLAGLGKSSTGPGKSRNGDGSNARVLQRSWTRPEGLGADSDCGRDGGVLLRSSSSQEAGLDVGQQAAALGLYA